MAKRKISTKVHPFFIAIVVMSVFILVLAYWVYRRKRVEGFTTEPSVEAPLIIYTGSGYTGVEKRITSNAALQNVGGFVRGIKILPGKQLFISHPCGNGTPTPTIKSATYYYNDGYINPCGFASGSGFLVKDTTVMTLSDRPPPIVLSDTTPVIMYSGSQFGGTAYPLTIANAPLFDKFAYSCKIKPGYVLTLTNHKCVAKPPYGCAPVTPMVTKTWYQDDDWWAPCTTAAKCWGAIVLPGTLTITTVHAMVMSNLTYTTDWYPFVYTKSYFANNNHTFSQSYKNNIKGIYVAYYNNQVDDITTKEFREFTMSDRSGPMLTNVIKSEGHYNDFIMSQFVFNTIVVENDRIGDGRSPTPTIFSKATRPDLFVNPSIPTILKAVTLPVSPLDVTQTKIAPKRVISVRIENR